MEPELVVGEIRGYRAWVEGPDCALHPLNGFPPGVLRPGESTEYKVAKCARLQCDCTSCIKMLPYSRPTREHKAPADGCTCGFYAVYGNDGLLTLLNEIFYIGDKIQGLILGSVMMSGKVIKGSHGIMRGERMRLEALLRSYQDYFSPAIAHKVPCLPVEDFLAQAPLENSCPDLDATTIARWHRLHDVGRQQLREFYVNNGQWIVAY